MPAFGRHGFIVARSDRMPAAHAMRCLVRGAMVGVEWSAECVRCSVPMV